MQTIILTGKDSLTNQDVNKSFFMSKTKTFTYHQHILLKTLTNDAYG